MIFYFGFGLKSLFILLLSLLNDEYFFYKKIACIYVLKEINFVAEHRQLTNRLNCAYIMNTMIVIKVNRKIERDKRLSKLRVNGNLDIYCTCLMGDK